MASANKSWKGAVEPNDDGTASSNSVKRWKGAVEPAAAAAAAAGTPIKYIVGGKVYEETGERKVIVGGKVLEEATAAAGGGQSIVPLIVMHHEHMKQANGGTL